MVKYDSTGNVLWAQSAGGILEDDVSSSSIDEAGNIYITGSFFSPTLSFGTTTLYDTGLITYGATNDSFSMYLVKYSPDGNVIWAKSTPASRCSRGVAVKADAFGSVYVSGAYIGANLNFGSFDFPNPDSIDRMFLLILVPPAPYNNQFLLKFDSTGSMSWAKTISGFGDGEYSPSIILDNLDNIFVASKCIDSSVFGTTTLVGYDIALAKYNSLGNIIWVEGIGGNGNDYPYAITVDNLNNLYITGSFSSAILYFGTSPISLTNSGLWSSSDMFLAKHSDRTLSIPKYTSDIPQNTIFPNPSSISITITSTEPITSLEITNLTGQKLFTHNFNTTRAEVDVSAFSPGMYFLRINGIDVRKFVKE